MASAGLFAVHVIEPTTSSIVPSSVVIGFASLVVTTLNFQPGLASTETPGITAGSAGNTICTLVVLRVALSLGTSNESFTVLPFGTLGGSIVTCAEAGPANAHTTVPTI